MAAPFIHFNGASIHSSTHTTHLKPLGFPAPRSRFQRLRPQLWQRNTGKRVSRLRATTRWRCEADADSAEVESSPGAPQTNEVTSQAVSATSDLLGNTSSSASNVDSGGFMEGPTKKTNKTIALASAATAVGLFLLTRGGFSGISLSELAASAVPYEEALRNGRPTVLEFYADWCEVCREMAPDVYKVEQQYKDSVNFVMLNVDNSKWEEEFDEFGVEGIPHFAFLDKQGNEEGNIVGRLPRKYLEENVASLFRGDGEVPHTRIVGKFSNAISRQAPPVVTPRSHSEF